MQTIETYTDQLKELCNTLLVASQRINDETLNEAIDRVNRLIDYLNKHEFELDELMDR